MTTLIFFFLFTGSVGLVVVGIGWVIERILPDDWGEQ